MTRLGRSVAMVGLVLFFGLACLISINSSLKDNGIVFRGALRDRILASSIYHKARNTSMASAKVLETGVKSAFTLLDGKGNQTLKAPHTSNVPSRDMALSVLKLTGSTGPGTSPKYVEDLGSKRHERNISIPKVKDRGDSKFVLAKSWNSTCATGRDVPRKQDYPWPMYRVSDGSLGIRPQFPWGSGKGLEDENFKQSFRYFLYDEGPFNMSGAEDCFRAKWRLPPRGSPNPFEGLDSKMSHENRMYLLELFLWQSIRDHPMRTDDPSKAQLYIIGYTPIMLDWTDPCAAVGAKAAREKQIFEALSASQYFKRRHGTDHLFLWTRYNLKPDRALRGLLDSGPIVAVLERSFFMLQRKWPLAFERGSVIMMPYVSSGFIDTKQDTSEKDAMYPLRRYFFRGNMKRKGEGQAREVFLPGLAKMLDNADFQHRKVNVGKDKSTVYTSLLNETSSELRRSAICPCPEGDSPTTLRPFEALAAGCVPVFMVEKEIIAYDIPFPSLIDWDSIVFFMRSMAEIGQCSSGLNDTIHIFDALGGPKALPGTVQQLEKMRKAGKEVFRKHMSYLENPLGVVSSMLYEANELIRRGVGHNTYKPHLRYVDHELEQEREKQHHHLEIGHTPPPQET